MIITRTVTKKILESIVQQTFTQFGNLSSSALLDSLKLLGFYYATIAGISINIEDLKTPDVKKNFLKNANFEIETISKEWEQGFISDTERFQSIIDIWNLATEALKNRIIDYYQNFDPANNLYIMAFSGARGNMSQVRQLVGMRGLMSDQEGKIIDLPIQTNFREGLSSIDYIISSYGARKGIVDTALKTADSGYLTRRLIYIAQDLVIREVDCGTKEGVIVLLNKNSNLKNLVGRTLLSIQSMPSQNSPFENSNKVLQEPFLVGLKKSGLFKLNVRSSLTCKSNGSICQKCYGWDLSKQRLISLGEAVGIIAAQSIGEPGTQLTMRTFHTGGIFTGETTKQILAPFSGKLIIPSSLKTITYRTSHGAMVLKLQQESTLKIVNWKGTETSIFLTIGSYLYISTTRFVKKDQLLAEYSTQSFLAGRRRLKPIYTPLAGEIRFEKLVLRNLPKDRRVIKVNEDDGVLWVASGKIFPLPKEIQYDFPIKLEKSRPFARLKIISPYKGIVYVNENSITLITNQTKRKLNLDNLLSKSIHSVLKFSPLVKNYQLIDQYTILGYVEFYPEYEGSIYSVRKKDSKYIQTLFFITESDIWKMNSDQVNNFSFFENRINIVRSGNILNTTSNFTRSGFFLKKDGFKMIFQVAKPIFLTRGTILKYKKGDFVFENKVFATLINYTQQTEDIVQGLPKIEELIEARRPKNKCHLAIRPGIFLTKSLSENAKLEDVKRILEKGFIKCVYDQYQSSSPARKKTKKEQKTQPVWIGQSLFIKDDLVVFHERIFKAFPIPTIFQLENKKDKDKDKDQLKKKDKEEFIFKYENETLIFHGKTTFSNWKREKMNLNHDEYLQKYKKGKLENWIKINFNSILVNQKNDYVVQTSNGHFLFLEYLNPIIKYDIPLTSKTLFEPGNFVDIAEPITEGIIDVHELLNVLFQYHSLLDGITFGTFRSLNKFQLILVNSIQAIYQSQGVNISSNHIEIIVKQMTTKVLIKESGDTPLLPGETIRIGLITEISKALNTTKNYKTLKYEPMLISATNSSLTKDGFLSSAGFQETKRVLTKAAIEGSCDWLRGLKECIIVGRLIPAGSTFLNYKNYLDSVILFKD